MLRILSGGVGLMGSGNFAGAIFPSRGGSICPAIEYDDLCLSRLLHPDDYYYFRS
jgi:hypothetical protein